jgi:hypothetical protein
MRASLRSIFARARVLRIRRSVSNTDASGIVGAAIASWLLGVLAVSLTGWIGYLIAGFIGACILIAVGRALGGAFQRT